MSTIRCQYCTEAMESLEILAHLVHLHHCPVRKAALEAEQKMHRTLTDQELAVIREAVLVPPYESTPQPQRKQCQGQAQHERQRMRQPVDLLGAWSMAQCGVRRSRPGERTGPD